RRRGSQPRPARGGAAPRGRAAGRLSARRPGAAPRGGPAEGSRCSSGRRGAPTSFRRRGAAAPRPRLAGGCTVHGAGPGEPPGAACACTGPTRGSPGPPSSIVSGRFGAVPFVVLGDWNVEPGASGALAEAAPRWQPLAVEGPAGTCAPAGRRLDFAVG